MTPTPPLRARGPLPIRSARVIVAAMAVGVLAMTGVGVFIKQTGTPGDVDLGRTLALAALGLGAGLAATYVVVRRSALARVAETRAESLAALERGELPAELFRLTIVGAALAEGFGLFGAVALLLGAPWPALAEPILAVALIVVQIPGRERALALVRGSGA